MSYKAGFEGKDAMRSKAEKMIGSVGKGDMNSRPSASAADKAKPRPYAAGGAAKVRKGVATPCGKQKK